MYFYLLTIFHIRLSSGGPCGDGFNIGAVNTNTPARAQCFLGGDEGNCGKRHFTFGLDVTKPLNIGTDSYYRGQGAVTFRIVEAPAASNVGPVSTGGGDELSSGMGFVVVREKTQPTVMFPVPVCIAILHLTAQTLLESMSNIPFNVFPCKFYRVRPELRPVMTW